MAVGVSPALGHTGRAKEVEELWSLAGDWIRTSLGWVFGLRSEVP